MKILRYRGIPINKVFSDDEFVEKTRKNLKRSRKFIWIHIAALSLLSIFIPKLIQVVLKLVEDIPDGYRQLAWVSIVCCSILGVVIGQYVMIALQSILMALDLYDFNRGNKLLIKYHGMLKEMGALEQDSEQQTD
ncbi:MAG: hypothetical protein PVJ60_06615 [Phycisphaerales bacterium]|jgi:hypothetical protein